MTGGILDRYVLRRFLVHYGLALLYLVGLFLVMDLVPGRPFPGSATPATWDQLAGRVIALLEILARVHAAGVVHRDLKPSNVIVGDDGRVTVLDFGVSWGPALGEAMTNAGTVVGTPEYLAPEQFMGAEGDASILREHIL